MHNNLLRSLPSIKTTKYESGFSTSTSYEYELPRIRYN